MAITKFDKVRIQGEEQILTVKEIFKGLVVFEEDNRKIPKEKVELVETIEKKQESPKRNKRIKTLGEYNEDEYVVLQEYDDNTLDVYMNHTKKVELGVTMDSYIRNQIKKMNYALYMCLDDSVITLLSTKQEFELINIDLDRDENSNGNKNGEVRYQTNNCCAVVIETYDDNRVRVVLYTPNIKYEGIEVITNYNDFNNGLLEYPNYANSSRRPKKEYAGEVRKDEEGYYALLVRTTSVNNVVLVRYKGENIQMSYDSFKFGDLNDLLEKHLNKDYNVTGEEEYVEPRDEIIAPEWQLKGRHIGESILADNKMRMTIERWASPRDLDVRFEDDHVAYNKDYYSFLLGRIINPKKRVSTKEDDLCEDSLFIYKRLKGITERTEIINPALMLQLDARMILTRHKINTVKDLVDTDEKELKSWYTSVTSYRNVWALRRAMIEILKYDSVVRQKVVTV